MAWFYVLAAGALEVVWAALLKASQGFTRPLASVGTVAFMVLSFVLLAQAMRSLPLGTAYAVAGSDRAAHEAFLRAIRYLQRDALVTTADLESAP